MFLRIKYAGRATLLPNLAMSRHWAQRVLCRHVARIGNYFGEGIEIVAEGGWGGRGEKMGGGRNGALVSQC